MNTVLPRCIVHIGAPKTGTTLLQKVLFENRATLLNRGVLYPEVSLRGYGHHDLAFLLAGGYPDWAIAQPRPLSELGRELAEATTRHVGATVISSENFFLFPSPEGLHALLAQAGFAAGRITILAYIRRQDDAHESWYNQRVKAQGETGSIDESVARWHDLWDYETQLGRWTAVFGDKNIVVRPYERSQLKAGSLVEDFFDRIGVDPSGFALSDNRVNTGLNRDILEFQRLLNQLPLSALEKRRFHHDLIALTTETVGTGLFDETPLLDTRRRREIMASYRASNAAVAQRYLAGGALFTGERDVAPSPPAHHGITPQKLAQIVGWLLVRNGSQR